MSHREREYELDANVNDLLARRLSQLIHPGEQGVTADKAGMSREQLNRWLRGKAKPNPRLDKLVDLAKALDVSLDYLLSSVDIVREPTVEYDVSAQIAPIELPEGTFEVLPLVSEQVAAGSPIIDESDMEDHYAFRRSFLESVAGRNFAPGRLVVVRVAEDHKGESMVPTIRPGALLVVDRGPQHNGWAEVTRREFGKIFLARDPDSVDGGAMVKRVFMSRDQLILWSDNPTHLPITVNVRGLELQKVLIGRVRWVGQEMD